MDLRFTDATPSSEERAAIDAHMGPPLDGWSGGERDGDTHRVARSGKASRDQRPLLIEALHVLQAEIGWISPGGLNYVCQRLSVPPADAFGVASFYAMFGTEERPRTVVHVCDDLACRVLGARELCAELEATIGPEGTDASQSGATWHRSPCLGMCEQAPAILAQRAGRPDVALGGATAAAVAAVSALGSTMTCAGADTAPQTWDETARANLRLLRRVGHADPTSVDDYRASGGYEALYRALEIGPEATIVEVKDSKLLGRGGAAFPTGVKWEAVATQPAHPHYFVCNADESEPGTFKDRLIMELDPFAVVESLTIAGVTTGCEQGYLYIRGEYPLATERLKNAIEEARRHDLLGPDIMGRGVRFDIELRRGAGAYICGEETALFNSLEGKRG